MPEVVSCPKCQRKSRVPDNLVGQRVKCPGCNEIFVAEPGGAAPAPKSSRKADEDDRAGYELADERRRRRDDEDEDEDERVSDRPRPRRGRDEEDDEHERVTSRRRRLSRDDYDDEDEDDDEGPSRADRAADWPRIRLGFSLLLASVLLMIGAVLVYFVGIFCIIGAAGAAAAKAGPGAGPGPAMAPPLAGLVILVILLLGIMLVAYVLGIVGHVLHLPAPRAYGAKTLAQVTLGCVLASLALTIVGFVLNAAGGGLAGLAGGANPMMGGFGAGGAASTGLAVVALVLGFINNIISFAGMVTFGLFVRAIGLCLGDHSLAGMAKGWVITLCITAGLCVLTVGAFFAVLGSAFFMRGGMAGGGPPPAALGGGMLAIGGLGCIFFIMALVVFIWYIVLLAQARGAITTRTGRRRY